MRFQLYKKSWVTSLWFFFIADSVFIQTEKSQNYFGTKGENLYHYHTLNEEEKKTYTYCSEGLASK